MIVVVIIGILATIALPAMRTAPLKAREAVLKADLYQIRSTIDQHLADKGQYPGSLQGLVDAGYLRFVPVDPITRSPDTWAWAGPSSERTRSARRKNLFINPRPQRTPAGKRVIGRS